MGLVLGGFEFTLQCKSSVKREASIVSQALLELVQNPVHGLDVCGASALLFEVLEVLGAGFCKAHMLTDIEALVGPPYLYQRKVMVPYLLDHG